jgi:hypothetical protein
MTNKTLGKWLVWTLVAAVVLYFFYESLGGLILLANWVFVFIGGYRLMTIGDKKNKQ